MRRPDRIAVAAYAALGQATSATGSTVLAVAEAPGSPMLNRVVGLGVDRPATEADVDEALAAIGDGVTYYVAVAPDASPAELPSWLQARGLEPGWGWMSFSRSPDDPPPVDTGLRLVRVETGEEAAAFARIQCVGFGLPEELEPVLALAPQRGWEAWLALDGDEPAGAGALFALDGVCYLGLGATFPEHRGKGAQGALLAHRIRRAGELGCDLVTTETGERRGDRPSNSYRNILRAGFVEGTVTANWLGASPSYATPSTE